MGAGSLPTRRFTMAEIINLVIVVLDLLL